MFFVIFWIALVRYTWLSNSSRFFFRQSVLSDVFGLNGRHHWQLRAAAQRCGAGGCRREATWISVFQLFLKLKNFFLTTAKRFSKKVNGDFSILNGGFSIQFFSEAFWTLFEMCIFFFQDIFSILIFFQNGSSFTFFENSHVCLQTMNVFYFKSNYCSWKHVCFWMEISLFIFLGLQISPVFFSCDFWVFTRKMQKSPFWMVIYPLFFSVEQILYFLFSAVIFPFSPGEWISPFLFGWKVLRSFVFNCEFFQFHQKKWGNLLSE